MRIVMSMSAPALSNNQQIQTQPTSPSHQNTTTTPTNTVEPPQYFVNHNFTKTES